MVAVVNHLTGHTAIDADVLARDKTSLIATKEQHHMGDIHGIPHSASGLLDTIGTLVNGI